MTLEEQRKIGRQDKLIRLDELKPYEFNNRNHPADQLDRICYGMEISPKYCQVILDRYIAHCAKSNKKADVRINGEVYNPVS